MSTSISPYLVLLLFCFSCSKAKIKSPNIDYSHYKEVMKDVKYNMKVYGKISSYANAQIETEMEAHHFFKNKSRIGDGYFVDTVGGYIFEKSEFGNHETLEKGSFGSIDASVITDMSSGRTGHFLNLLNQHVRNYQLYGKRVIIKQSKIDTIVIPDYERRLNKLISDLQIKDLESLQLVLSKVLGYRIQNKEELREEATLYDISRLKGSKNYDAEEMEICEKILKKSSADRCIYLDGYCDLYETPQRGFYQVFYNPLESGFDIQMDLINFECNFIRDYQPYSKKIKLDRERVRKTINWIRPPQLRDRIK